MKSLSTCLESLLADDDIFLDPENDKKVIEEWIKKQNTCPLDFTEWIQMKFID